MKNIKLPFYALLWAALITALLCGCSAETSTEVIVDQSAMYAEAGKAVELPAAAIKHKGVPVEGTVVCTVLKDGKEAAVFDGLKSNAFTPAEAGVYTAEYLAEHAGEKSHIKQIMIVAARGYEAKEGIPELSVESTEQTFASYSAVTLRAARGKSSAGTDISSDIEVVLIDAFSKEVFSGKGNMEQNAGTLSCGTYIAVYTLENGGMVNSAYYLITVIDEGNIVPVIDAPETDVRMFTGQELRLSPARAKDPVENDISAAVKVRIEDSSGKIVFAEASATEEHRYTFSAPGEYRVIYTCKNSGGKSAADVGYKVTVLGSTSSGILIDGTINEMEYAAIPSYRTGLGGNALFYFHKDDDYLYIAAFIKDTTLTVSKNANTESGLNTSDGVELMIDPRNSGKLNAKDTECVRIRIGADGSVMTYTPAKNGNAWQSGGPDMNGNFFVKTEGTLSYTGSTKATAQTATDTDTGYTAELRIPWQYLGFNGDPTKDPTFTDDHISIAFGHRDVSSPQHNTSYTGVTASASKNQNNTFYNGMNYVGRDEVATLGLNPLYYEKLYLRGEYTGVNPVVYNRELILDGYMENGFWDDAYEIPYGTTAAGAELRALVKTDKHGIYIGAYIHDSQLIAEPRSFHSNRSIKFNDRLDIRIADSKTLEMEAIPNATQGSENITNGKIIFLDPLGAAQMQMLQAASGRCLAQLPYAYATVTKGTVGYSKYGNLWSDGKFVADTDIYDIDSGWGAELFIPWSSIGMNYPEKGESAKIGILVSVLDRNADPTDAAVKNSLISWDGRARSVLSDPSSYHVIEVEG